MTVKVSLELEELQLETSGCPEQRPVETFAAYRADQAFDKGMRQRHVRHRLDGWQANLRILDVEAYLSSDHDPLYRFHQASVERCPS